MKWILTPILLISFIANAQEGINYNSIAEESSESLDVFGYAKPDFKWDMEGRVQAALNEGINYLDEGSPGIALPQLDEAIKLSPDIWVAHYYKGVCLKQLKRFPEAEKEFLRVNELHDKNILNYIELGKTADLELDFSKGERWFEKAIKIDPKDPAPVYLLANHCSKFVNPDRAKRLYKECLKLDPRMLDAEVKLAVLDLRYQLSKTPKTATALKYLEDVLAKDSLHKQALIFHGILKIEKEPKTSLRDFDRLVRLNPANVQFRFIRGMLLTQNENYDLAFSDLRKVIDAAQLNSNKFIGRQTALDKRIDIEYAGFYVVSNVYGFPDEDALRLKKAYCLLFPGRYDEALKAITEVKGSATSPLCLFLKGLAYEHKATHELAYHAYDSALRFDDDILDAHKKRGIYRMELKQWNFAEFDFRQMLRINPEAYVAYRLRGLTRINNYKYKGAIEDFTAYLDRDSSSKEIRGERGMAFKMMNDHLSSTLDLLKSKNFQAIEPFQMIELQLNQLLSNNDTTKAMWWLNQFNKYGPTFIDARKMTLKLLAAQKKWPDVEKNVDDALAQQTGRISYGRGEQSYLFMMKGVSLTHRQNAPDAIRTLDKAIEFDKNNAAAYVARAEANLKLKNKAGALADLQQAINLGDKTAAEKLRALN